MRWYLAAACLVLGPLAVALVYILLGNPVTRPKAGMTASVLLGQLCFTLFPGPLAEEAGWRGFALPRLQERYNALASSLILSGGFMAGRFGLLPPMILYVAAGALLALTTVWVVYSLGPQYLSRKPRAELPFSAEPTRAGNYGRRQAMP